MFFADYVKTTLAVYIFVNFNTKLVKYYTKLLFNLEAEFCLCLSLWRTPVVKV